MTLEERQNIHMWVVGLRDSLYIHIKSNLRRGRNNVDWIRDSVSVFTTRWSNKILTISGQWEILELGVFLLKAFSTRGENCGAKYPCKFGDFRTRVGAS